MVGRAFRCPDGLVRWVTAVSRRGSYELRWLDESTQTWHYGGKMKATAWPGGEEVPAPRPGDTYRRASATGFVEVVTVPDPGA